MPCPYANLFKAPGTDFHSTRLFGVAAVDLITTILAAFGVAWALKISVWVSFLYLMIIAELLHYIFGTQTALLTALGIKVPTCE